MDRTLASPGIAHYYQRLAELSTRPSPAASCLRRAAWAGLGAGGPQGPGRRRDRPALAARRNPGRLRAEARRRWPPWIKRLPGRNPAPLSQQATTAEPPEGHGGT
jgi:hypothetical protein